MMTYNEAWKKKSESCFDVAKRSSHDAEVCELVGIYILSNLTNLINQDDTGLYRDDGWIVVKNLRDQRTGRLRKNIVQLFKNFSFKTEIKMNLTEVDLFNVTFNLIKEPF